MAPRHRNALPPLTSGLPSILGPSALRALSLPYSKMGESRRMKLHENKLPPLQEGVLMLPPLEGARMDIPAPIEPSTFEREIPSFKAPLFDTSKHLQDALRNVAMKVRRFDNTKRREMARYRAPKNTLRCRICNQSMSTSERLALHELMHERDRESVTTYQCPYPHCSVKFKWLASLSAHIDNHERENRRKQGAYHANSVHK